MAIAPKPAPGKLPGRPGARDKRLTHPTLFVDLRDKVYKTTTWDPSRLIIDGYDGPLETGEDFAGVMKISGSPHIHLFDGKVVKSLAQHQKLAASFRMNHTTGKDELEKIYARRDPEGKRPLPAIMISLAYKTVNWSLSGMLIKNYHGKLQEKQVFAGLIRLEKTEKTAVFRAEVVRRVAGCNGLAVQFRTMADECFDLFECAMMKSSEAALAHVS